MPRKKKTDSLLESSSTPPSPGAGGADDRPSPPIFLDAGRWERYVALFGEQGAQFLDYYGASNAERDKALWDAGLDEDWWKWQQRNTAFIREAEFIKKVVQAGVRSKAIEVAMSGEDGGVLKAISAELSTEEVAPIDELEVRWD